MNSVESRRTRGGGRLRHTRVAPHAGRLFGYLLGPVLSSLTPLLVLPAIAASTDDAGWAAIAIGQSIGLFAMVVVVYGWTVNGPFRAAQASREELGAIYHESLVARSMLFVPTASGAALAAWMSAPSGWGAYAAAVSLAFAAGGLSSAWLCIGLGRPLWIVVYETLPRLTFALVAGLLIRQGATLWLYPVLLAVGTVLGIIAFSVYAVRPEQPAAGRRRGVAAILYEQSPSAVTTIVGATYAVGAIFLASTVTTSSEIAQLSSADRVYRLSTVGITIAASLLTPWIAVKDKIISRRRTRSALAVMSTIGLIGLPAIAYLAPLAARILFGADFEPSRSTCWAYGVAFLGVAISTTLGQHFLVPRGRVVDYMTGSLVAAIVGAPAILALSARFGADGAAAGLAVSELTIVAVLLLQIRRMRERRGDRQVLADVAQTDD